MTGQNTLYVPSLTFINSSVTAYWVSLYTCVFYLTCIYFIGSTISLLHLQCIELSIPQRPTFTPTSHRKPFRKKRKRWRHQLPAQHRNNSSSDLWGSPASPTTCYYKDLHRRHFGTMFSSLCDQNPGLVELLGVQSPFFVPPSLPWQHPVGVFMASQSANSISFDISKLVDNGNPFRFQTAYLSEDGSALLIFDTGASTSISPFRDDFVDFHPDQSSTTLQGVSSTTPVAGRGTIRINVTDDKGFSKTISTPALYVPGATVRLLSIQSYCRQFPQQRCSLLINDSGAIFSFPSSLGGGTITFDLGSNGNLPKTPASTFSPIVPAYSAAHLPTHYTPQPAFAILSPDNANLSNAQKLLLDLHWRLMHINLGWVQWLVRKKVFVTSIPGVSTATCKCHACQLGKQTRNSKGSIKHTLVPSKIGNLKKNSLQPGAVISTDQFESSVKGRLPHTYGKEHDRERYTGGTLFVDEASEFMFVKNQVSLGATETIAGKTEFEREAIRHGVLIKSYRGDNGVYRSKAFQDDLRRKQQPMVYSGVGAHHHNGVAERAIRTVSTNARTMLLHAMIHWPSEVDLSLWPFAVDYAVYLWNLLPKEQSGLSPTEIFYSVKSDHSELKLAKVWGCPTFVLDPRLQDAKKIPKWEPRSQLGQFLGRSKIHSSSVGLIRNVSTGKVSAQFHVVYDNHFTTLDVMSKPTVSSIPDDWKELFKYHRESFFDPNDISSCSDNDPSNPNITSTLPQLSPSDVQVPEGGNDLSPSTAPEGAGSTEEPKLPSPNTDTSPVSSQSPTPPTTPTPALRRSSRVRFKPDRLGFETANHADSLLHQASFHAQVSTFVEDAKRIPFHDALLLFNDNIFYAQSSITDQYNMIQEMKWDSSDPYEYPVPHPLAFSAAANAEDSPNLKEALDGPDREGFIQAMHDEISQLEKFGAWDVVPRTKAIQERRRVLASTWVFKRKRFPDGTVKKLKARICVRGDQQILNVDYFDTFSPVVQWSTIRLMFILSLMLNLHTVQVDYTLAFVQAKADPGTYVEMPKLFEIPGKVLELKRNLYGQCESPRKFYDHLKKGLQDRGLKPSPFDHCLFMGPEVSVVMYVDDCIFFAKDQKDIKAIIKSLREPPKDKDWDTFLLSEEEDYAGFLGIDISPCKETPGSLELLQTGLIDRICVALGMDDKDTRPVLEPASSTPLGKDTLGTGRKYSWNYASLIGMMLYLSSNSRPDIAFSVHQAARFTHCARHSHEKAIIRIAKYLKATRNKGLRINPKTHFGLELYADADFAGLWNIEHPDDATSVKSRTGYLITLGGVPVTWASKLQTEIATSTMHSEYIALSSGMRELIPIKNTFEYICNELKIERPPSSKVIRVWEDNEGALKLATSVKEKVTPHTKHFAIKYHWFREKLDELKIVMKYIDTKAQKADLLTKGLTGKDFISKRSSIMGW